MIASTLAVGQPLVTGPATAAPATAPERYNPYVSGNRVVFTQVDRRPDGTSTAGVWARDLRSGAETLVADVATGEPLPVTDGGWTAWSESPTDGRISVRARADSGGPILDLFTTALTDSPFYGQTYDLPLAISGDHLSTTNGQFVSQFDPELVRFDLPSTRPTFVDVMSTGFTDVPLSIAQAGTSSIVAEGFGPLFSIVDASGNVTNAPAVESTGCFPNGSGLPGAVVAEGNRIAFMGTCSVEFGTQDAILTCLLPCDTIDVIALPFDPQFDFAFNVNLTLSGGRFYFARNSDYAQRSGIFSIDAVPGSPVTTVWTTSDQIGPRISASGNHLVWDQVHRDGVLSADIYDLDTATGTVRVLRPNGADRNVARPTGPLQHDPDINGNQIVYASTARDRSSAGIWMRQLDGRPRLISTVATDASAPRTDGEWIAWNTRTPEDTVERVVASRGAGRQLVDVYHTSIAQPPSFPGFTPFVPTAKVDISDGTVAVTATAASTVSFFGFPFDFQEQRVFTKRLPDAALRQLLPSSTTPFSTTSESEGHIDGRNTVSHITPNSFFGQTLNLYNDRRPTKSLTIPTDELGFECRSDLLDISATDVVVGLDCYGTSTQWLASCDLPCDRGLARAIQIPPDPQPIVPPFGAAAAFESVGASGSKVAVVRMRAWYAGRYYTRSGFERVVEVYDLKRPYDPPVVITTGQGKVSDVRIDRDRVVFSLAQNQGGPISTVYLYDLRRGRLTAL